MVAELINHNEILAEGPRFEQGSDGSAANRLENCRKPIKMLLTVVVIPNFFCG